MVNNILIEISCKRLKSELCIYVIKNMYNNIICIDAFISLI